MMRSLFISVLLLFSFGVHAADVSLQGPLEITRLAVTSHGLHLEVNPSPAGCTSKWSGMTLLVEKTHVNYSLFVSMLLAAFSNGQDLQELAYDHNGDPAECNQHEWGLVQRIRIGTQ